MSWFNSIVPPSFWMASGIVLIALFLGLWQWFDRRSREPDAIPDDREFFRRQDLRRAIGIGVLAMLAVAILVESVLPSKTVRGPSLLWVGVVFGICGLIIVLIALAAADWNATRGYARRHRRALAVERARLLEAFRRTRPTGTDGGPSDDKEKTEN